MTFEGEAEPSMNSYIVRVKKSDVGKQLQKKQKFCQEEKRQEIEWKKR